MGSDTSTAIASSSSFASGSRLRPRCRPTAAAAPEDADGCWLRMATAAVSATCIATAAVTAAAVPTHSVLTHSDAPSSGTFAFAALGRKGAGVVACAPPVCVGMGVTGSVTDAAAGTALSQ